MELRAQGVDKNHAAKTGVLMHLVFSISD